MSKHISELQLAEARVRVVIEDVRPAVDGGRFAAKRTVGELVRVTADVFTDGHDAVAGDVLYRQAGRKSWRRVPLTALVNDRFEATFPVEELGRYEFRVQAWVDPFETWWRDLKKRVAADQDITVPLQVGAALLEDTARRVDGSRAQRLAKRVELLRSDLPPAARMQRLDDPSLRSLMRSHPDPDTVREYPLTLAIEVERERARFSSWYEFFPRSCGGFRDCEERLRYAAALGFNVIYLPPIHPIGREERKGPNNNPRSEPGDTGSPWAIGAREGGHKAIHPELGTLEDFHWFVERTRALGMEVALDIAFQCAPDHPYVTEHPEWFRRRPDGSIQYAENPPKRYQDIYPFDFDTTEWKSLWKELLSVVEYWIDQGVLIFRVDNPHTKAFRFWEWLIDKVRRKHPEVIFLAEAFTRPKVMHHLAKLGYSQSYTYFTWRTEKQELIEYFTELSQHESREYFRPNVWPNTPDILHEYLQTGGRPAFMIRAMLAATLAANYGIYGPAFELCEGRAVAPGSEEYLDSEKYQLRSWDTDRSDSVADLIALLNEIRNGHRALQHDWELAFHAVDNDHILAYSKGDPRDQGRPARSRLLMVVTLDPQHVQSGWVELPLESFGLEADAAFEVHDLLTGARYPWRGSHNFVKLDPHQQPGHIFEVCVAGRDEADFEGYT